MLNLPQCNTIKKQKDCDVPKKMNFLKTILAIFITLNTLFITTSHFKFELSFIIFYIMLSSQIVFILVKISRGRIVEIISTNHRAPDKT